MWTNRFEQLFLAELQDIYDAELRFTHTLPRLIRSARAAALHEVLAAHLELTHLHVAHLESVFGRLDQRPKRRTCRGMVGLLAEGEDLLGSATDARLRDVVIIAAVQKIDHYEIATYGTLREWAQQLGHREVITTLQWMLEEEVAADRSLSRLAASLNAAATAPGA